MSELFTRQSVHKPMSLLKLASNNINVGELEWQECGAAGFMIKPLMEDATAGLRTWLMKVDADAFSDSHAHDECEQIYVLEGSFYDQEKTYLAGEYIVRAPAAMHTAGSESGALVLLFYSPDAAS
jgi:anti-sigma factor ChrR (cupin superfamily)